VLITN
jgi:hypothetical protein